MSSLALKRSLDVICATVGLLVFSPLLLGLALTIGLRMGRPILFVQTRAGRNGRLFSLYKFRTMLDATDADGKPLPDASRLTPFGKWLRASSLDELPELLNVIRGDMSLVGPRPLLPEYLPLYSARQARRHEMLPGLTGLAQVSGRNSLSWDDRLELDVQYVEHWTLALDIQILLRTVGSVLSSEGISAPGHVSMEKFTGSASAPSDQSGGHQ